MADGEHGAALRVRVRPFQEADYPRMVEIINLAYPDRPQTVEEVRHRDATWEHRRYAQVRVVADDDGGRIVGIGRYNHIPDEFHPDRYWLEVTVDPALRQREIGGALYEHLLAALRARGAMAVRAGVYRETDAESIAFLARRGFVEVQRGWQSRLDVASFVFDRFAGAEARVTAQGIVLTTLAAEMACDADALPQVYAFTAACERDVPSADPVTETSFEHFLAHTVGSPNFVPDAFFLAKDGARAVGLSAMYHGQAQPDVLHQGLTGLLEEYRGRGVAMALKLPTVRYARDRGCGEIWTWNGARNQPMLRINEAMGFVKQPAWIGFRKTLRRAGCEAGGGAAGDAGCEAGGGAPRQPVDGCGTRPHPLPAGIGPPQKQAL